MLLQLAVQHAVCMALGAVATHVLRYCAARVVRPGVLVLPINWVTLGALACIVMSSLVLLLGWACKPESADIGAWVTIAAVAFVACATYFMVQVKQERKR